MTNAYMPGACLTTGDINLLVSGKMQRNDAMTNVDHILGCSIMCLPNTAKALGCESSAQPVRLALEKALGINDQVGH